MESHIKYFFGLASSPSIIISRFIYTVVCSAVYSFLLLSISSYGYTTIYFSVHCWWMFGYVNWSSDKHSHTSPCMDTRFHISWLSMCGTAGSYGRCMFSIFNNCRSVFSKWWKHFAFHQQWGEFQFSSSSPTPGMVSLLILAILIGVW